MTTKKIGSSEELNSTLLNALRQPKKGKKGIDSHDNSANEDSPEKVDIALSRAINSELNSDRLAAERKEKVARLKELVQSGKYNPSSEAIAEAVGEEIVFEILSNQDR